MKIITTIASLFLSLNVLPAIAGDVTYVGGGRYTCSGSGCAEFNAAQASRNSISEKLDDLRTEDKIRRMRELSQINAERLSEGKAPLDTSARHMRELEEEIESYNTYGERFAAKNKAREKCMLSPDTTYKTCAEPEPKYYAPPPDVSAGSKTVDQIAEESRSRADEYDAKLRARKECERETLGTFGACDHLESKYVPASGEHETSYAHAEQVSRKCEAAGKLSEKAYKYKKKGMRAAETIAMADKMSKFDREYFLDGAISDSEQEAYMKAWSECMDDNN